MSYIWQNFSEETIYTMAEYFSPYLEVLNSDPHYKSVNVLLRFYPVFKTLLQYRNQDALILEGIENPVLAFLADLDRLSGTDYRCILEELVADEIDSNCFGTAVKRLFNLLTPLDKKTVLDYIILENSSKGTNTYLRDVLVALLSTDSCNAILYWQESLKRYIMYSPLSGSQYDLDRLSLVKLLFLDIGYDIEPVWKYHFGVVGVEPTMVIDSISIV